MKNIEDIHFFILTERRIYGNKKGKGQLNIFKTYGTKCAVTDHAILCGSHVSKVYTEGKKELKNRTDWWWSKTALADGYIRTIDHEGDRNGALCNNRNLGVRPACKYSDIKDMCFDEKEINNKVKEAKCFHGPLYVVSEDLQNILEQAYLNGQLIKADKKILRDKRAWDDYNNPYEEELLDTYVYKGETYTRVKAKFDASQQTLSNGVIYQNGSYVWEKEEPYTLFIDKEYDIALFKEVIMGGIPFDINSSKKYDMPFKQTFMYSFLKEKLPMMLKPATALQKSTGIDQLEFSMNPFDIASLYQNGNITLKNASGESVKINLEEKKEPVKVNRKAKIGFEKLI